MQRIQRVRDGSRGVGCVELIKINEVGAEPTQAVLNGLTNIGGFSALAVVVHRESKLSRKHDLLPAAPQSLSEELLALPSPVYVRCVEKVYSGVEGGLDHLSGRR